MSASICRKALEEAVEYSYPGAYISRSGDLHIAYTWRRKTIKHVSFTAGELRELMDAV
ncbi:hypothetical protein HCH_01307 [Hahella chejuensis KCTC 2396]|uniref:Uncharacterized protein n=1 Tax=Hahella chejuensis (strain KCTC 2396) TaxID=349521 RepID=Q2SMF0_HAHCH|nr:hypothetical protein HCH_01307 [Hahella chejuensis KCTC 2396]